MNNQIMFSARQMESTKDSLIPLADSSRLFSMSENAVLNNGN